MSCVRHCRRIHPYGTYLVSKQVVIAVQQRCHDDLFLVRHSFQHCTQLCACRAACQRSQRYSALCSTAQHCVALDFCVQCSSQHESQMWRNSWPRLCRHSVLCLCRSFTFSHIPYIVLYVAHAAVAALLARPPVLAVRGGCSGLTAEVGNKQEHCLQ